MKSRAVRISVLALLVALPVFAAPPRPAPVREVSTIEQALATVLRWIKPLPPQKPAVPRKCGGTMDPNGNCKP